MPSSDHNEMGKPHWGIRWETARLQLAAALEPAANH